MADNAIVQRFSKETTIHGIIRIASLERKCSARVLWTLLFLGANALFLYHVQLLVGNFFKFPSVVQTSLEFKSLPFPAVTICNINPFRMSSIDPASPVAQYQAAYQTMVGSGGNVESNTFASLCEQNPVLCKGISYQSCDNNTCSTNNFNPNDNQQPIFGTVNQSVTTVGLPFKNVTLFQNITATTRISLTLKPMQGTTNAITNQPNIQTKITNIGSANVTETQEFTSSGSNSFTTKTTGEVRTTPSTAGFDGNHGQTTVKTKSAATKAGVSTSIAQASSAEINHSTLITRTSNNLETTAFTRGYSTFSNTTAETKNTNGNTMHSTISSNMRTTASNQATDQAASNYTSGGTSTLSTVSTKTVTGTSGHGLGSTGSKSTVAFSTNSIGSNLQTTAGMTVENKGTGSVILNQAQSTKSVTGGNVVSATTTKSQSGIGTNSITDMVTASTGTGSSETKSITNIITASTGTGTSGSFVIGKTGTATSTAGNSVAQTTASTITTGIQSLNFTSKQTTTDNSKTTVVGGTTADMKTITTSSSLRSDIFSSSTAKLGENSTNFQTSEIHISTIQQPETTRAQNATLSSISIAGNLMHTSAGQQMLTSTVKQTEETTSLNDILMSTSDYQELISSTDVSNAEEFFSTMEGSTSSEEGLSSTDRSVPISSTNFMVSSGKTTRITQRTTQSSTEDSQTDESTLSDETISSDGSSTEMASDGSSTDMASNDKSTTNIQTDMTPSEITEVKTSSVSNFETSTSTATGAHHITSPSQVTMLTSMVRAQFTEYETTTFEINTAPLSNFETTTNAIASQQFMTTGDLSGITVTGGLSRITMPTENMTISTTMGSQNQTTTPVGMITKGHTGTPPIGRKKRDTTNVESQPTVTVSMLQMNTKATSDMNYMVESALQSGDPLLVEQYANVFENLTEFIQDCSYNTVQCNISSNFVPTRNSAYGMCFTFNHLLANMSSNMVVTRAGPGFGLRIRLNVHQAEYMYTTDTAGVRVAVHNQNEQPFPETVGYSAQVGTRTSLGLTMIETTRLPSPYGKCTVNDDMRKGVAYFFNGNYTSQGCIYSCIALRIAKKCGCLHQDYPKPSAEYGPLALCNSSMKICADSTESELLTSGIISADTCGCNPACSESNYQSAISSATFPSEMYLATINCSKSDASSDCYQDATHNQLLLEVFYQQLNYQGYKMQESYSTADLISDLGGQLGLWIGASVLSIAEFLSFLLSMSCYGMKMTNTDVEMKRNKVDRSPSAASIYDMPKESMESIAIAPRIQR